MEHLTDKRGSKYVSFYVDGACAGNHRKGKQGRMGAGVVRYCASGRREWSAPLGAGTNQRAELLAVREALMSVENRRRAHVAVYTDSEYAIGCLVGGWKAKVNHDIIESLLPLIRECAVFAMVKVAGHSGHPQNERANDLAVEATQ